MESSGQSSDPRQEPESQGDISCSSLEISGLVPSTARNVSAEASPAACHPNPDQTDSQSQQTRHCATTSRMGCLRERFRGQKLSGAPLPPKDICRAPADPISGDISEVVNFLANLFQQGYQYRSLNAYRSAISSVHDRVDGYEVGQHPLITRLIKGAFHERPPQPRCGSSYNIP